MLGNTPSSSHGFNPQLCLVTDSKGVLNDQHFLDKIQKAIEGGVTCIQLREANPDRCLALARALQPLLTGVTLIINNHADVALATQSGLHIGQDDLPYEQARHLLGPQAIIGLTVNHWKDVEKAQTLEVNYLGVQVFPSMHTKPKEKRHWQLQGLRQVRQFSRHPLMAIGGIQKENLSVVWQQLNPITDGIAMTGLLWRSENPCEEAQKLRNAFTRISL